MANTTLVNTYLRMARRAHPDDNAARIEYLDLKLAERDKAIESGDWEVNSTSFAGESQSSNRNINSEERAAAIQKAIEVLTANPNALRLRTGIPVTRISKVPN